MGNIERTPGANRSLGLIGAPNARDLGGLITPAGDKVRTGLVFRAPALGRLTDEDVVALGRLGIGDVLDLRHGSEIDVAPPDRLPAGTQLAHIPIYDPAHPVFTYVSAVLLGGDLSEYADLVTRGTPGAMMSIYRWFVASPVACAAFGTAMSRIVDASGPLLFHCSAGKDRTGWLSAVLLAALGVDRDTIRGDFMLTNSAQAAVTEALLGALARRDVDADAARPVLEAAEAYLDAAFAEVDTRYGSFDGYLRDALGVDEDARERLRARFLH